MNFEEAMSKLEEVVTKLESGELSLSEALALFEQGMGVARLCQQLLDQAEGKIEQLLADGGVVPFEKSGANSAS